MFVYEVCTRTSGCKCPMGLEEGIRSLMARLEVPSGGAGDSLYHLLYNVYTI